MSTWDTYLREPLRWPLALMGYGFDWLRLMADTVAGAASEAAPRAGGAAPGAPVAAGPRPGTTPARGPAQTTVKENRSMRDQDLSGDDLKLVRYRVLFVKREYEVAFPERDDLLTYSTGPAEYGGLKIAEFMEDAAKGGVAQPPKWKAKGYPPANGQPPGGWSIPSEDRKYVKFYFEVLDRIPREKAEYAKDQVDVLREISAKIG